MRSLVEIAFFTDHIESMADFYQKLLGEPPVAQADGMVIFMMGKTKLFIHKNYQPAEGELPPENHFAYAVEDVDAACRTLQGQGLSLEISPQDYYWGRSAYLRDPDGHLVELTQETV